MAEFVLAATSIPSTRIAIRSKRSWSSRIQSCSLPARKTTSWSQQDRQLESLLYSPHRTHSLKLAPNSIKILWCNHLPRSHKMNTRTQILNHLLTLNNFKNLSQSLDYQATCNKKAHRLQEARLLTVMPNNSQTPKDIATTGAAATFTPRAVPLTANIQTTPRTATTRKRIRRCYLDSRSRHALCAHLTRTIWIALLAKVDSKKRPNKSALTRTLELNQVCILAVSLSYIISQMATTHRLINITTIR